MELGPDTETMGMPSDHERVLEATQLAENPQNPTEVEKMELKTHLDLLQPETFWTLPGVCRTHPFYNKSSCQGHKDQVGVVEG